MKELSIIIVLLLVTIICASIYTNNEQSQKLNNEKSTITVKEQVVEKTYEEILDEDMNLYDIRRIFDEFINLKNSDISYSSRKILFSSIMKKFEKISDKNLFAKLLLEKFENSDFNNLNSINKTIFETYLACLFDFDSYKYGRGVDDLGLLSEAYTKNFNNEFFDEYKAMYIKFENYPKGSGDYIQLFVDESGDYTKKSIYQSQELYYVDYGKTSIRENDSYYHDCNEYVEKNGDFILAHENAYGHLIEYDGIDEFNEFLKDNEFVEMIINYRNNIWLPLKIKSYEEYIEKERKEEERINAMKNKEPKIGMTAEEVEYGAWGKPDKINKDTYSWGTTEQWVYKKGYVYFQNGRVTSVSESF